MINKEFKLIGIMPGLGAGVYFLGYMDGHPVEIVYEFDNKVLGRVRPEFSTQNFVINTNVTVNLYVNPIDSNKFEVLNFKELVVNNTISPEILGYTYVGRYPIDSIVYANEEIEAFSSNGNYLSLSDTKISDKYLKYYNYKVLSDIALVVYNKGEDSIFGGITITENYGLKKTTPGDILKMDSIKLEYISKKVEFKNTHYSSLFYPNLDVYSVDLGEDIVVFMKFNNTDNCMFSIKEPVMSRDEVVDRVALTISYDNSVTISEYEEVFAKEDTVKVGYKYELVGYNEYASILYVKDALNKYTEVWFEKIDKSDYYEDRDPNSVGGYLEHVSNIFKDMILDDSEYYTELSGTFTSNVTDDGELFLTEDRFGRILVASKILMNGEIPDKTTTISSFSELSK